MYSMHAIKVSVRIEMFEGTNADRHRTGNHWKYPIKARTNERSAASCKSAPPLHWDGHQYSGEHSQWSP
jgi:hypothetical protein